MIESFREALIKVNDVSFDVAKKEDNMLYQLKVNHFIYNLI